MSVPSPLHSMLTTLALGRRRDGDLLAVWPVGHALLRFVVETLRDDPARQFLFGFSTSLLAARRRSTPAADLRG